MVELPRKAKGERPVYLGEGAVDALLAMLMNLAGEVAVLRERLDTAERLLDESGGLQSAIASYRPSPAVAAEREAWRASFLDMVLGPLSQERQALETAAPRGEASEDDVGPASYASVVELVSSAS